MAFSDLCYLFLLLAIGRCFTLTYAQCTDPTVCSSRCYPEHWRRQLCVFYAELQDWRETAAQCGLDTPEIEWDHTQSSTIQWDDARTSWNALQEMWRELAEDEGIIVPPGGAEESSGSANGLMDPDERMDSETGGVEDRSGVWRNEQSDWSTDLEAWKTHIQDHTPRGVGPYNEASDLWMDNLIVWSTSFAAYNTTYYEICSAAL